MNVISYQTKKDILACIKQLADNFDDLGSLIDIVGGIDTETALRLMRAYALLAPLVGDIIVVISEVVAEND